MSALKKIIKKIIKTLFLPGINFIKRHPKCRLYAVAILNKLGLRVIVRSAYRRFSATFFRKTINSVEILTPHAREIYIELKNAIEKHKQENC